MTRPISCASDRVVQGRWALIAALLFGLPTLCATTAGAEYGRPVHSASTGVHYGPAYATPVRPPARAGAPAQRIPAYGPAATVPTRQAAFSSSSAGTDLRAYPCTAAQGAVLDATLNEQYGDHGGVRIVYDRAAGQLLVMAPEAIQQQVAGQIRAVVAVTSRSGAPPQQTIAPPAVREQAAVTPQRTTGTVQRREYQLRHVPASRLESVLGVALGDRWTPVLQAGGPPSAFQLAVAGQANLTLHLDYSRNRVLLEGPAGDCYDACTRLIQTLDTPKTAQQQTRCLVSLTSATTEDLKEAVAAIHTTNGPAARRAPGRSRVLLAQATGQLGQQPIDRPLDEEEEEVTAAVPMPGTGGAAGVGLIGPVQIQMLDGLDVIVIKGHKRDVQQVVELIQQIEEMTVETEPAIVVRHLKHVDCEALATLVNQLYEEVYSPRQGSVSITALVKPNALLMIGRPESVETVAKLVNRLDQPVPPETQFKVFRLRHAAASTAQATIEEFFQNAEGDEQEALGARVHVIADVRSNSLIVRASPRDMLEVASMIEKIDTRDVEAVNDLRVFQLKNSLAEDLEPILQDAINGQNQQGEEKSLGLRFVTIDPEGRRLLNSGILTDVRVTADPRANALLISAPAESMPLIEALIAQLDKLPVAEAQVKVFTIINGDASLLAEMLESLFGQATNQSEPPVRTGASGSDSSLVSLQFAVDVRTNSIIATGSIGDLAVVEAILLRLDESEVRQRKTVVYRLKNAPAEDVEEAINEYLDDEAEVRTTQEGLFSTFEIFEKEVIVVAETVSNSLIVSATPEYYDEIANLVEQLDERPAMVMIQVLIAEVQLNDTEEFGIEMGLQDSILFDRSLLGNISTITNSQDLSTDQGIITVTEEVITSATNDPGFLFNDLTSPLGNSGAASALGSADVIGSQGLSNFGVGRLNSELGFGGLVLSASSESVSMLLRALKEDRRIDILSRPQVMTLDNQGATIQVGERVPRVTGTSTNESGGITNTVTLEDVGLIIGVTPRISPDGLVVMEIDAEKSEVGAEADGIPISVSEGVTIRSPRIKTISAITTVSALDGQTVVLGGLITSNKTKVDRRVPWLADIPVLGQLFRYQGFTKKRSELLIIMTPRIIESEEDAELVKQEEAARMNWCLEDVLEMHEDVAFRPRDGEWGDHETMTVYPDGKAMEEGDDGSVPLKNIPLEPQTPTPAPPLQPSGEARNVPGRQSNWSGYVAPATYSEWSGADRGDSGGVYPATNAYGTGSASYPSTSYRSPTGY